MKHTSKLKILKKVFMLFHFTHHDPLSIILIKFNLLFFFIKILFGKKNVNKIIDRAPPVKVYTFIVAYKVKKKIK